MASQRWQCDTLGKILLKKTWIMNLCGCYFDVCNLPKYCCRPNTPLHDNSIPQWQWLLSAGWFALPHCKNWNSGTVWGTCQRVQGDTSQLWAPGSSGIWKSTPRAFLWVCYTALWHIRSSRFGWLASCFLEEARVSLHLSRLLLVGENWQETGLGTLAGTKRWWSKDCFFVALK